MNHVAKARSRIYWQYRSAPKLQQWVETLPALAQVEIEDPLQLIVDLLDIEAATGELLDIIGRIVGIARDYQDVVDQDVEQYGAAQFGGSGMQFKATAKTLTQQVEDAIYRILIRSQIAKNVSDGTLDSIAETVSFIVRADSIRVQDGQDMTFSIAFGSELTGLERFMLTKFDLVPRPQGVKFLGFSEIPSITQFNGLSAVFGDKRAEFAPLYFGA